MNKSPLFARVIAGALFVAVLAGTWDAWWHGAIGRDSFWELPHLFLYTAVLCAITLGIYGWKKYNNSSWKYLAFVLLLIPISAPFDELWHRAFGVEDLSSPLIVWSPPHLVLIFALVFSLFLTLFILLKDTDTDARRFFSAMTIAASISLLSFVISPLIPTGPWQLIGFWGAGIFAAVIIGGLLYAEKKIGGIAIASTVILFVILLSAMSFGEEVREDIKIVPHDHAPGWLTIFALLIPAAFLDLSKNWKQFFIRGGIAAGLWGFILYGFSSQFFEPTYQYGFTSVGIAILASFMGGLLAAWLVKKT
ncbi:hypothetical protein EXS74_02270 [Candidatus Woesearchaeota archaeon]|nr:hypothetical protein [Candidatus Woesearchaeota archaeon]